MTLEFIFIVFSSKIKIQKIGLQKHTERKKNYINNNIKTNKNKDKDNLKNNKKINNNQKLYVTELPIL